MAATELGNLLTKWPFGLSLWHDGLISWHGGKELEVWHVLPIISSILAGLAPGYANVWLRNELDPQANLPRWWPPDLHADAGQETHQRICQFLLAESCSIFLNQICWIFDDESMLIMVCYFKRICEINPAEDRVTWPNLLHRHPSTLVSFQEWLVASTTRVAPNSGPAPKSLLTPEFRLVLDLVKWDGDRGGYFVDPWPGRGRSWITGLAGISELGPNSEPCGNNWSFADTCERARVPVKKIGSRDSIFGLVNSTYFLKITNHNQHAFNIKYLANLIKKYWTCFHYQKLANFLVCFPPSVRGQVRWPPSWKICLRIQLSFGFWGRAVKAFDNFSWKLAWLLKTMF